VELVDAADGPVVVRGVEVEVDDAQDRREDEEAVERERELAPGQDDGLEQVLEVVADEQHVEQEEDPRVLPREARARDEREERLGRTGVIQRRFNVSVPRARVPGKASTLRDRSER
jgi:hypothetical protein